MAYDGHMVYDEHLISKIIFKSKMDVFSKITKEVLLKRYSKMHMIFYFVISFKANRRSEIIYCGKITILSKLRKVIFLMWIFFRSIYYFHYQITEKCYWRSDASEQIVKFISEESCPKIHLVERSVTNMNFQDIEFRN